MSENKGNNESSLNPEARIKSIGTKQPRVDLVKCNAKTVFGQEVSANVGLNVDTGVDIRPDTVAASVAGFGGSIGRTIGVSTPLGGIKFKLW